MKETLKPLASLGVGFIIAIVAFSRLIRATFDNFPYQTNFLFLGLVVATVPLIYKQADVKTSFKFKHYIFLVVVAIITAFFALSGDSTLVELSDDINILKILFLMFAGILVGFSMVLPGLSGALMLMLIGAYHFLLESLSSFNLVVLGSVAVGAVIGIVICSRLIKHLFENNKTTLYSISTGLIIGSIPVMLSQGVPNGIFDISTSLISGIIGFMVVTSLNSKKA
jgi:putative membrane protein